ESPSDPVDDPIGAVKDIHALLLVSAVEDYEGPDVEILAYHHFSFAIVVPVCRREGGDRNARKAIVRRLVEGLGGGQVATEHDVHFGATAYYQVGFAVAAHVA